VLLRWLVVGICCGWVFIASFFAGCLRGGLVVCIWLSFVGLFDLRWWWWWFGKCWLLGGFGCGVVAVSVGGLVLWCLV